jgi:WD40 repeat protein
MPEERPGDGNQIFLSYGHRDAMELALRLRDELEGAGYSVWQDAKRIRAGHAWTDEIRQGLRESDLVIALLSPHAVRRKGWSESAEDEDSVCLDEIEYAVDACKVPVLPVMAVTCEPPFRIFRLQYLDFRAWQESRAHFDELVQTLLAGIVECIATGRAPLRSWARLPEPWDFTAFLAERRRRFIGRGWLFDALRDRLAVTTSPAILVTGSPGVGKSAFFASLVYANPAGQILAYHCCQATTPATLAPAVFVRSVAAMIAARDATYAGMLEHPDLVSALDEAVVAADPASAFEQAILNPLYALPAPDTAPRLLMIDALDEALGWPGSPNLLDLLSSKLGAFPDWLKIVATTRDESSVKRRFRTAEVLSLDEAKTENEQDLRAYAFARLGATRGELIATLLQRADGNFLVLVQTLNAVETGLFDAADLDSLAPGLDPLYEGFFDRLFERAGVDFAPSRTVLQSILAAQEPASRDELAAVTGLDAETDLPALLARLASFVPPRAGRYSPFHKTLVEWLTGWNDEEDQPTAGDYYISLKSGHRLWAKPLLERYTLGPHNWDLYLRRHLPTHLAGAELWDELSDVLLDVRYLEGAVKGPGTTPYSLLADFDLALRCLPEMYERRRLVFLVSEILRLDAAFLAESPDSLFQCLWNRGHWHDAPAARAFFVSAGASAPPWERLGPKLSTLVDRWRAEKERQSPGFPWLRALRPLPEALGTAQRAIIRAESDGLDRVAVSPDGLRIIASLPEVGSIGAWDAASGAQTTLVEFPEDKSVHGVRFFPAGPRRGLAAAVTWDGRLIVLDEALEIVDEVKGSEDNFGMVAVSPDGLLIATGDWKGVVKLWEAETLSMRYAWQAHAGRVTTLEFSACGQYFASGEQGEPSFVRVWAADADERTQLAEAEARGWVESICFAAGGERLYWGDYDGNIERWDWRDGARSVVRETPDSPASVVRLLDDTRLLCGVGGASDPVPIEVWNLVEHRLEQRLTGHLFGVGDIAVLVGTQRFVSGGDATLRIWDLGVPSEAPLDALEPEVSWVAFRERDGHVITASETSDTVWVRGIDDGTVVWKLGGHSGTVSAIALSANGDALACAVVDGSLDLWDLPTGTRAWHVERHKASVEALAFSPDGSIVASAGEDGRVCLTAATDGRLLQTAAALHKGDWVHTVAFSNDGELIASGGYDSLVVWNARTKKVVLKLPGETHYALWFAPGDKTLIARGPGESAMAWTIASGERLPPGSAIQALYDAATLRKERRWQWDESTDTRPNQMNLALIDGQTGLCVARFPELRGFIQWHPDGRIWVNQRSRQVWLLELEGGDISPSAADERAGPGAGSSPRARPSSVGG